MLIPRFNLCIIERDLDWVAVLHIWNYIYLHIILCMYLIFRLYNIII